MTERIIVHPFEDLRVENYTGLKQAGEHAYVKLSGMIPCEKREEYMELGYNQVWVYINALDVFYSMGFFLSFDCMLKMAFAVWSCYCALVHR